VRLGKAICGREKSIRLLSWHEQIKDEAEVSRPRPNMGSSTFCKSSCKRIGCHVCDLALAGAHGTGGEEQNILSPIVRHAVLFLTCDMDIPSP